MSVRVGVGVGVGVDIGVGVGLGVARNCHRTIKRFDAVTGCNNESVSVTPCSKCRKFFWEKPDDESWRIWICYRRCRECEEYRGVCCRF